MQKAPPTTLSMPTPTDLLESLVARCLEAGAVGYRDELDRQCQLHPAAARALRERVEQLERLGFLGQASDSAPGMQWLPDRIGGYRLLGVVGRGGMGIVFRARAEDGREVAVKIVRPDLLADERARERFRREGALAARLSDPGICTPLDVGVDDGVPFLVMPLLAGSTFGAWWRDHRGETARMLELVEQFARALHVAHEVGLVHRDVTPGNLFVTDGGRAVVLDFGLARDIGTQQANLTMSQEQLGTLPYMAPEQIRGAVVDRRCDVYALGVVLYEALSGRLPFAARQRSDLSRLITTGEAPRLRGIARGVPRALSRVVACAMDVDVEHRYGTASELAEDLQRCRHGEPIQARRPNPVLRMRRWGRNHPLAAVTMGSLAVLLLVASGLLWMLQERVRVQRAMAATLSSRALEDADPMRAIEQALQAHETDPTSSTLGQLNRLLHQVSMLATVDLHPTPVRRIAVVAVDPEHDRVAVASEGALSLFLLHRRSGALREERIIEVESGVLLGCVRFSPNGRFVACGGTQKAVYVTPVDESKPRRLFGAVAEVIGLVVDDDGSVTAAVASGQVLQWDAAGHAETPRKLLGLPAKPLAPGLEVQVRGIRAGPGGDFLVWNWTCALRLQRDGTRVWHTAVPDGAQGSTIVAFDGAAERILLAQAGTLRLVRWSNGEQIWKPELSSPVIDATMTDGGTVASLHADGVVRIWTSGNDPIAQYRDPDDQVGKILAVPGAECFLVAGCAGTLRRIDVAGRVERSFAGGDVERWGAPGPYAWSTDGTVLLAGGGPGRLRTWDFDGSRNEAQARIVESPPVAVALHPDGLRLLVATLDQQVWLWGPDGARPTPLCRLPFAYRSRGAHQPGAPVVFGGLTDQAPTAAIFDPAQGSFRTLRMLSTHPHTAVGVAWLPGQKLAVGFGDNRWAPPRVGLLDIGAAPPGSGTVSAGTVEVAPERGMMTCLDATRDGRWIVAGYALGGLDLWSREPDGDYRHRRTVPTRGRVWSVNVAAAGDQLVAGIEDGSVLRWRFDAAEPEVLVASRGRPARAMYGGGDRLVVEFVPDGLLHVWDVLSLPPQMVLEAAVGEGAGVLDAAVFPVPGAAGRDLRDLCIVTIGSDGWVRRWSLDHEAVAALARQRLTALRQK